MAHVCPMCSEFTAPTFKLLQQHLFRVYSGDFDINCCNVHYRSASAYRKHIQLHHRQLEDNSSLPGDSVNLDRDDGAQDNCMDVDDVQGAYKRRVNTAKWILKLKEGQKLTQSCVDRVLEEVTELCTVSIGQLGDAVQSVLQSAGFSFSDVPGMQELFALTARPFDGLDTYHRQLTFYTTHMDMVVSYILIVYLTCIIL